ncbi:hypothetical protein DPMN_017201 [Dreissena polymorpha]|uniref:Uncharacterized protein n=1 Tax=Dreissena polymorpha TaxID=45954 RepID=A0A9D4NE95_DREPO|nr:hypothetical protein DPMN_017201 [Dreissena polymorpha]
MQLFNDEARGKGAGALGQREGKGCPGLGLLQAGQALLLGQLDVNAFLKTTTAHG